MIIVQPLAKRPSELALKRVSNDKLFSDMKVEKLNKRLRIFALFTYQDNI